MLPTALLWQRKQKVLQTLLQENFEISVLLRRNLKIGFDNQNIMKRIIYIATLPARHGSDLQCSQQVAFFVQSRCTLQPFSPENQGNKRLKIQQMQGKSGNGTTTSQSVIL